MSTIETGKYKGKKLAECPGPYILWASQHRKNFGPSNRWVSDEAKKLLEKKEEKSVNTQKVKIDWVDAERGKMAVCVIVNGKVSALPKVRPIDPAIIQEVEDQFLNGGIATISVDDDGMVRKVDAA